MTCREFVEHLLSYLSGELPADARAEADRHLLVCEDCVSFLRSYELTIRLGSEAHADDDRKMPDDLVEVILSARKREG